MVAILGKLDADIEVEVIFKTRDHSGPPREARLDALRLRATKDTKGHEGHEDAGADEALHIPGICFTSMISIHAPGICRCGWSLPKIFAAASAESACTIE